jgi:hypothetical protein
MVQEQAFSGLDYGNPYHHLKGVWAALCFPNHFGHVTRNSSVEVVSVLTWWEGVTMVRPQWRLGRAKEQILSGVLPYIPNRYPTTRDTQLPTKKKKESIGAAWDIFLILTRSGSDLSIPNHVLL